MTTTDPTKPHICTADGGPVCPGHTPNCEPGCAQPAAAADSTGRPPRVDGEDIVIRDLRRQLVAARQETARVRSQLAEARQQRDQAAAALVRAETERDGARLECATLEQDMDEIEQCLDETEQQNAGLRAERDEAQDRLRTLRHRIDELVSYMGAWTTSTWADKQDYVYDTLTRALAATAPETGGVVTGTARQLAETLDSRPNATQTGEQTEVRADTHTEAQTGYQGPLDLDAIRARWLHPCGPCDAGYPTGCTCPPGDPRTVIAALVTELDQLRAEAAMLRARVREWEQTLGDLATRCDSGDIPIRLGERYSQAVLREIDRLRTERDRLRRRLGDVLDLEELPEDHTIVAAIRRLRAALGATPDTKETR